MTIASVDTSDAALLQAAIAATGGDPDAAVVDLALELARGEAKDDACSRFAAAARRCRLNTRDRSGPVGRAARRARVGAPVILWASDPLVVLEHDGRHARVLTGRETELLLDDRSLAARAGVADPRDRITFTMVERAVLGATDEESHHETPIRRLMSLLRPEAADLRAILTLSLGVSILTLATPVAADQLVSSIAFGGLVQPILVLSVVLAGCLALAGAMRALQAHVAELVQRRMLIRLLGDLVHRLPRVDRVALDGIDGPELVNRFYDVVTLQKGLALLLVDTFALVLSTGVGLAVLGFYHPVLLAVDAALVLAVLVIVLVLGRGGVRTSIDESRAKHAIVAFLEELARNRSVLDTAEARKLAESRGDARARAFLRAREAHWRIVLRQTIAALGLQALGATTVLAVGGALVLAESLTLGQLVAAEIIVTVVLGSVAKLGKHLESFYDLVAAADKIGHLLDLPIEESRLERVDGSEAAAVAACNLELPGSRRLDLAIRPGERVAITGRSGSGKSLVLARLAGIASGAGTVSVAGKDVLSLDAEARAEVIVLVDGHVALLTGTIFDNVRVGRADVDADAARRALGLVDLERVVDSLPGGLLAELGPRGGPLSRGELLRLCLARAIARKPRLLMVDGVLEELDPTTRRRVLDQLVAWRAGWTLIVATTPEIASAFDRRVDLDQETVA